MVYVTSDLHGYSLEKFKKLLGKVGFCNNDFLYILGDVIDRGPDGIKILKWLLNQPNAQLILGNHEAILLSNDFLFEEITDDSISKLTDDKIEIYMAWLEDGAQPTISALAKTDKEDREYILEYIEEAPLFEVITVNNRDFILTHSGLGNFKKDKRLSEYTSEELLWTRPKITDVYFNDIITVFGHTPTGYYGDEFKGKILKTDTWIDIDVGAGSGYDAALLRLDDLKEFYL